MKNRPLVDTVVLRKVNLWRRIDRCVTGAVASCEFNWNYYDGNCYKAKPHDRDQATALSRCPAHDDDAQLVSISNQDEMNFVAGLL